MPERRKSRRPSVRRSLISAFFAIKRLLYCIVTEKIIVMHRIKFRPVHRCGHFMRRASPISSPWDRLAACQLRMRPVTLRFPISLSITQAAVKARTGEKPPSRPLTLISPNLLMKDCEGKFSMLHKLARSMCIIGEPMPARKGRDWKPQPKFVA